MKKLLLILACAFVYSAQAQSDVPPFSISLGGNYSMYKGSFQKSTPGLQIRVGYNFSEKATTSLGYTYGFAIKESETFTDIDNQGNPVQATAETSVKFQTFTLQGAYNVVGTFEDPFRLYIPFGCSFVRAKSTFKVNGASIPGLENESESTSGFTLNAGVGASYNIGLPSIFLEGGVALPANKVNDQYVTNYIPAHFVINAGIKIPLSFGGGY